MVRAQTAEGVAIEAHGVAVGNCDGSEIACGVVGVTGALVGGVGLCDEATLAVVVEAGLQAFFAFDLNLLAPAVVAVVGGVARAVCVAGELRHGGPGEVLLAAVGVFDGARVFALIVCVMEAGCLLQCIGDLAQATQLVVSGELACTLHIGVFDNLPVFVGTPMALRTIG